MKEDRILRELSTAARADGPPPIDVAEAVLTRVTAGAGHRDARLWMFASLSSAAAVVMTVAALRVLLVQQDPFGEFINSVVAVMP